jgi:hypothetical protein
MFRQAGVQPHWYECLKTPFDSLKYSAEAAGTNCKFASFNTTHEADRQLPMPITVLAHWPRTIRICQTKSLSSWLCKYPNP